MRWIIFLFDTTIFLCLSGYELIQKNYHASLTVIPLLNDDESIVFYSSHKEGFYIILNDQTDNCTCYISTAKMMQYNT